MGAKLTQQITRESAINTLTYKAIEASMAFMKQHLRQQYENLSNKQLEDILDECFADEFTDYWVVDKIEE